MRTAVRPALVGRIATAGQHLSGQHWHYGWVVVAVAFLGVAVGCGLRAAYGVLLVPLADSLSWRRGVPATAFALTALTGAVCAAPLGALFDRWGPRRVFASAAVITGLGLAF